MHSLALVPDTAAQLTNYTCTAQNSLGQGRATLQLSGGHTASTSSVIISAANRSIGSPTGFHNHGEGPY